LSCRLTVAMVYVNSSKEKNQVIKMGSSIAAVVKCSLLPTESIVLAAVFAFG